MKNVYGVYKQTDMIEGRGGVVLERVYHNIADAWVYANRHSGIMGRGPKGSTHSFCPGWQCKQCWPYGGDWNVRPMKVYQASDTFSPAEVNEMRSVADRIKQLLKKPGMLMLADSERSQIEAAAELLDQILER